ncbi:methylenetetrahydrofolate reductase, partial [Sinorhizobium meliloti]
MNGRTPYPVDCDGLRFSFEYFPPKNDEMETQLFQTVTALSVFAPAFVTVTYGAGGSTKARSLTTVKRMIGEMEIANTAAHLTCVGAPKAEVDAVIDEFLACGVRHFVALRGDPQGGIGSVYEPFPGGYENAAALVKALRARGDFEISVSAYPEKHPESPDVAADIDML